MLPRYWTRVRRPSLTSAFGLLAMVLLTATATATPTTAEINLQPWLDISNRDDVMVAFELEYGRGSPSIDWTGSLDDCRAGDSSEALRRATIRRVNYYRAMAGVPAVIVENPEFSQKAQFGALMMSAEGLLSHEPDESYECYSETGRESAANSNLYLGQTGPSAIDGYIRDPGEGNKDVGHRNTILHPPTVEMGVGHVEGKDGKHPANVLWVFDSFVFSDGTEVREKGGFVAWPPAGYVPTPLIYPRWSFGLSGADFSDATVTMWSDGGSISLDVVERVSKQGHVPSPIIVWEPEVPFDGDHVDLATDQLIEVRVEGVVIDGVTKTFSYDVVALGDRPPENQ